MPDTRSRWRRFVERLMPYYDHDTEVARAEHTEEVRRNAIAARLRSESVRRDYALMEQRLRGKP